MLGNTGILITVSSTLYWKISSNIYCLEKKEVNSSESRGYMGIPGKGLTESQDQKSK